eukprot:7385738-Prymnesium_polylepis.1
MTLRAPSAVKSWTGGTHSRQARGQHHAGSPWQNCRRFQWHAPSRAQQRQRHWATPTSSARPGHANMASASQPSSEPRLTAAVTSVATSASPFMPTTPERARDAAAENAAVVVKLLDAPLADAAVVRHAVPRPPPHAAPDAERAAAVGEVPHVAEGLVCCEARPHLGRQRKARLGAAADGAGVDDEFDAHKAHARRARCAQDHNAARLRDRRRTRVGHGVRDGDVEAHEQQDAGYAADRLAKLRAIRLQQRRQRCNLEQRRVVAPRHLVAEGGCRLCHIGRQACAGAVTCSARKGASERASGSWPRGFVKKGDGAAECGGGVVHVLTDGN